MKLNIIQQLKNFKDEPLLEKDISTNKTRILTLKDILVESLMKPTEDKVTGVEKLRRFEFAQRLYKSEGDVDITAEELVLLKTLVNSNYSAPLIVGQVYQMLTASEK